jgi:hypothetical protein
LSLLAAEPFVTTSSSDPATTATTEDPAPKLSYKEAKRQRWEHIRAAKRQWRAQQKELKKAQATAKEQSQTCNMNPGGGSRPRRKTKAEKKRDRQAKAEKNRPRKMRTRADARRENAMKVEGDATLPGQVNTSVPKKRAKRRKPLDVPSEEQGLAKLKDFVVDGDDNMGGESTLQGGLYSLEPRSLPAVDNNRPWSNPAAFSLSDSPHGHGNEENPAQWDSQLDIIEVVEAAYALSISDSSYAKQACHS